MTAHTAIDVAIIGAGPCGLAAAISARAAGLDALVFDAQCVVSSITQYPTYATFFSTAEKLSLGGLPFVTAGEKPSRRDALAYYRAVVRYFGIPVRQYEPVSRIDGHDGAFVVHARRTRAPSSLRRGTGGRPIASEFRARICLTCLTRFARGTSRFSRTRSSSEVATRPLKRHSICGAQARA